MNQRDDSQHFWGTDVSCCCPPHMHGGAISSARTTIESIRLLSFRSGMRM